MSADIDRRAFLYGLASLTASDLLAERFPEGASIPSGLALAEDQGEHLIHFRDGGDVFIKASPTTGSYNLALGTQQVMAGTGIPIHRHTKMEEAFFILEGQGTFLLNDQPHVFAKGSTLFIPKNAWHGFQNPDHELLLLWIVSPPGLENFFREVCSKPGEARKQFTREHIRQIALKYNTEFR